MTGHSGPFATMDVVVVAPAELAVDVGKEGFAIAGAMEKRKLGWRMAIAAKVWNIGFVLQIVAWDTGTVVNPTVLA